MCKTRKPQYRQGFRIQSPPRPKNNNNKQEESFDELFKNSKPFRPAHIPPGFAGTGVGKVTDTLYEIYNLAVPGGRFYVGVTDCEGERYVVKMTDHEVSHKREVAILRALYQGYLKGLPKAGPFVYDYGLMDESNTGFIVSELLWFDLNYIQLFGYNYTPQTRLKLDIMKVRALQRLHAYNISVCDMKDSNFCFTRPDSNEPWKLHFVDFGQANFFREEDLIELDDLARTRRFHFSRLFKNSNMNRAHGFSHTRRVPYDNMESLLYAIGTLPGGKIPETKLRCFTPETYEKTKIFFGHQYHGIYEILCKTRRSDPFPYDVVVASLYAQLKMQVERDLKFNIRPETECMIIKDGKRELFVDVVPKEQPISTF
ncbi:unnamed protein product [Bursaphelenchus okinawaensis]|uniref:Protein kinase domain-containing protein n=1 Tax=Bursaphelenchus okinawaensis TaxID=465554 RepID=A0A811LME1_9BILA|nr:unnamed protein product [Bursaphelenchus okinawaensis]CAG9124300.1 unnamed protein product [Bursaphelenchus okinawaensis]